MLSSIVLVPLLALMVASVPCYIGAGHVREDGSSLGASIRFGKLAVMYMGPVERPELLSRSWRPPQPGFRYLVLRLPRHLGGIDDLPSGVGVQWVWIGPDDVGYRRRYFVVSPWLLTALVLTASYVTGRFWWRKGLGTGAHPPGVCPHCGYDLRATPNRCPECGQVPSPQYDKPGAASPPPPRA